MHKQTLKDMAKCL